MFEDPGLNMLAGAFLAGIVGVLTAVIVRLIDNASRRQRVARAIFTEMIQALNQMISTVGYIDKISRYKNPKMSLINPEIVRLMRPLDRSILPALGEGLGYLSSDALNSTVAFEGTMQSESRRMREPSFDQPDSQITVTELRNRICWSLSLVADYAEVVAGDAYRRQKRMHEANHQIIDQARELAKTAEPRPGENEAATPVSTSVEPAKTAPPT